MNRKELGCILIGAVLGIASVLVVAVISGGAPAYAQYGSRQGDSKAVQFYARASAMQEALGGGLAGAMADPEFYVLFDDGSIRKKTGVIRTMP